MPKRRRSQDDSDDGDDGDTGARYHDADDEDDSSHRKKRPKPDEAELAARRHEKEEQRKERRRQRIEEKRTQHKRDKRAAKEKKKGKSQPQRTLENTREFDETIVESNDFEVAEDEQVDQLAGHLVDAARVPKILITTTPKPTRDCLNFVSELLDMFVGAHYLPRRNYQIKKMVTFCKNRDFTHIVLVNEFKHEMHSATIICLPDGPTAHFRLSSTKVRKKIQNSDLPTTHLPELVLNNFNTRLGHTVGRIFQSLFPQMAEFTGRRVATFHNQRDYIFFRHHRYIFESGKSARIQELGPQFTLKLKWLQRGTFDTAQGEYEWIHRREMDTSRRRFFL